MNRMNLFLWLQAIACLSFGQASAQDYIVRGTLRSASPRGPEFCFKLVFTESRGKITGYSMSGTDACDERKCTITGYLDSATRAFSFKETERLFEKKEGTTHFLIDGRGTFRIQRGQATLKGDAILNVTRDESYSSRTRFYFVMQPDDALNQKLTAYTAKAK